MKAAIICICFLFAVTWAHKVEDDLNLNTDEKGRVGEIEAKCLQETKANKDEVKAFDEGKFADNKPLRCFYRCLLSNFGVLDEQGRIVISKINLLVPEKHRTKAEHCFNVEKGEPCDVAYDVYKCFIQSVYKH